MATTIAAAAFGCVATSSNSMTSLAEITAFFETENKRVVTFIGYSGTGYQDATGMLSEAKKVLEAFDPATTIINIGATEAGIGAVYTIAKTMGFTTTGIVSILAKKHAAKISPSVDRVFLVADSTWGGRMKGTTALSPTSQAIVSCSDEFVAIGGGEIGRDEYLAARQAGKKVTFIPADMNHSRAVERARRKGLPLPTDFRGAAGRAISGHTP